MPYDCGGAKAPLCIEGCGRFARFPGPTGFAPNGCDVEDDRIVGPADCNREEERCRLIVKLYPRARYLFCKAVTAASISLAGESLANVTMADMYFRSPAIVGCEKKRTPSIVRFEGIRA